MGQFVKPQFSAISREALSHSPVMQVKSLDPRIKLAVRQWPEDARCEFEERAAILEYDGKMPRLLAEHEAYQQVLAAYPDLKQAS